jgi:hypothetical protein
VPRQLQARLILGRLGLTCGGGSGGLPKFLGRALAGFLSGLKLGFHGFDVAVTLIEVVLSGAECFAVLLQARPLLLLRLRSLSRACCAWSKDLPAGVAAALVCALAALPPALLALLPRVADLTLRAALERLALAPALAADAGRIMSVPVVLSGVPAAMREPPFFFHAEATTRAPAGRKTRAHARRQRAGPR